MQRFILSIVLVISFHGLSQPKNQNDSVIYNAIAFMDSYCSFEVNQQILEDERMILSHGPQGGIRLSLTHQYKDSLRYSILTIFLNGNDSLQCLSDCIVEWNSQNEIKNIYITRQQYRKMKLMESISKKEFPFHLHKTFINFTQATGLKYKGSNGHSFKFVDDEDIELSFNLKLQISLDNTDEFIWDRTHIPIREFANVKSKMGMSSKITPVVRMESDGRMLMERPLNPITIPIESSSNVLTGTEKRIIYFNLESGRVLRDIKETSWSEMVVNH